MKNDFVVRQMSIVYWSNSKMIQMLYDYNTECNAKRSASCSDVDIDSTGKTWLSFILSIVCYVSWPNGKSSGFTIQGS